MIERLKPAQAIQFLREIGSVVNIPNGTKHAAIYISFDDRDGVTVTLARDEPIIDTPHRPAVIEREASECTDYAGL